MFDAAKARRQKLTARMRAWRHSLGARMAHLEAAEADAKLAWNRQEKSLRRRLHKLKGSLLDGKRARASS